MVMVKSSESNPEAGNFITAECEAIFCIEDFRDLSADNDARIEFDLVIHSATDPSQVGKKIKRPNNKQTGGERFSLVHVQNRICEFACALGIYTIEQWRADKAAGLNRDLPFENTVGMMFASPIRHKRWDEKKDPEYWGKRLAEAQQKAEHGEDGADKEIQKCERILREQKGNLQIGGESGFTFWGIGDVEADEIPLSDADLAQFPRGLPTKLGPLRFRGQQGGGGSAGNGAKLPPKPPATSPVRNTNPPAQSPSRQAAPAAPAPAMGSSFV